ncbi:MAG: flagellar export chaperone FliS [Fimbriimonadaceae bacterium]|nr:MAG: flagellar export chaperone FliS [Fimbriimonadaceae bacterium]
MAYPNSSVQQYRKSAIDGASPLQLVIMLYDGAMRFINAAKVAMEEGNLHKQNEMCIRAQDIITELISCLDVKQGGEIAGNLFALYTFAFDRIVQANIEDTPIYLDQATKVLSDLRESWAQIEKQTSRQGIQHANAA